ncbi:MAG: nuclear transport factor 2 family protein, partial [Pseudomonadota bacterium]
MRSLSRALKMTAFTLAVAFIPHTASANETETNLQIITDAFKTWEQGTYVFGDILAPNIKWTILGSSPVAGTYTDLAVFIEEAARPVTSRLTSPLLPKVHDIWAVDDTVIIRWDGSAPTTGGGTYENQFLWIFTMEDGLVTEAEAFLDLQAYDALVANNEPRATP